MKFIVTGGAGFIGSHVVAHLLAAGHAVDVVDDLRTGDAARLGSSPALRVFAKDVREVRAGELERADALIHLAGTASVAASWSDVVATHDNNTAGVLAAVELCAALGIKRFVFASSAAIYGDSAAFPVDEGCEPRPTSPYGLQKLVAERYLELFAGRYGVSAVALRLFNVFGPQQAPDSEYAGVISRFVAALRSGQPLTIYGDGKQTRDFVYAGDVAQAFLLASTASAAPGTFEVMNLGLGKETSLLRLIDTLSGLLGLRPELLFRPARRGDIRRSCANISRASAKLGFRPAFSVESGLARLLEHSPR